MPRPSGESPARTGPGPALGTRNTELGDWRVLWVRDRQRIRILRVRNIADDRTVLAVTDPAAAPDLADARERYPELAALWDAVRHHFWARASESAAG